MLCDIILIKKGLQGKEKKVLFAYGKGFNYNLESKHERKRSKNRRKMKYIKITAELNFIGFKHCRMQRKMVFAAEMIQLNLDSDQVSPCDSDVQYH